MKVACSLDSPQEALPGRQAGYGPSRSLEGKKEDGLRKECLSDSVMS